MFYLLLCRSLTYAQRTSRLLEHKGITASVTKAPKAESPHGCSYGVKIRARDSERSLALLKDAGLAPLRILMLPDAAEPGVKS